MIYAETDVFFDTAAAVLLREGAGSGSLTALEWEPTRDPHDPGWRVETLALMRAQGETLVSTPALSAQIARLLFPEVEPHPYAALSVFASAEGFDLLVPTFLDGDAVVFEGSDDHFFVVQRAALHGADTAALPMDPTFLERFSCDRSGLVEVSCEPTRAAAARNTARLLISAEILGACEHLMSVAVAYATDRTQFGVPIGQFQAVQHFLAEAEAQLHGLRSAIRYFESDVDPWSRPSVTTSMELLKALAGRTGNQVAQATLQVLGGIGCTWEHEHHRYVRRILSLDQLFGSSSDLFSTLGRRIQAGGIPALPGL